MSIAVLIVSSYTPHVDGKVTINAPKLSLCFSASSYKFLRSIFPSCTLTNTNLKPANTAEAGLVP